ncbi:MAG: TonB-dependent receptor plug domain-containing protein, partial [Flammeovirgaceae bacterium]
WWLNFTSTGQGEYVEVEEDMIEEDKTTATVNRKVATKNSFIASANTFSLSSSSATLEEIVVVSYSTSVNLQGTNSSATLQPTMSGALVNTLSGKVAGVQVTPASGASSLNEIRIRGSSSINSNSSPLVVLDGIPLMNTLGEASSDLNLVNAENIKNMTVLKGGTATALYGSRGAHGVILITTKRPNEFVKDMIWKPAQYIAKYVAAKTYSKVREFYAPAYQVKKSNEERIDFRNTIFWEPNVQTDKNGTASLSFYNSDATTVFRMIAEGVGINGQVTRAEETYHTILPFSMDAKVPPYLTFEDKLELPVILKNNTNQTIKGKLLINVPEQLESLNGNVLDVSLKAQDATTIYVPLFVKSIAGKGTLGIQFKSKTYQDEFVKDIDVESKGFPVSFSLGGNELNKKVKFIISDPVAGSIKADFIAYRDVVGQLMDGLESIFREPHGCFEQTSSSTYPNLLALSYLRESGRDNPEIETKALGYIKKGYKRLISFECPKGGFDWFGRGPASVWLTAYGVMEFNDMKAVYNGVSQPMINRTLEWLLQQQNESGRFSRYRNEDQHDYHKHYNRILNAYVVYALANAQVKNINRAYQHAYQDALSSGDAYLLGLVANAAFELGNREEGNALLAMLKKQIRAKGMQSLKVSRSITYGRGVALQVEAASLTVLAMLQARDQDMNLLNNLVKFIASKNRFGGYGNTQATIMALRALVAYAKQAQNKFEDGKIEVTVNNRLAAATSYSQEQKEGITYDQLGQYFTTGEQQLGVQFLDTKTAWPYSMNVSYTSYTPVSSSKCEVDLIIKIASEQIDLGGTVRLTTTVQNKSSESQGMVMALIGIPSGLSPQPWQLKELQEKRVVDYYEVHKNYLVCYFTGMEGNEKLQVALDLKAEVPGTYQAPASSAYLYYTDEYKDWEAGLLVRIER